MLHCSKIPYYLINRIQTRLLHPYQQRDAPDVFFTSVTEMSYCHIKK